MLLSETVGGATSHKYKTQLFLQISPLTLFVALKFENVATYLQEEQEFCLRKQSWLRLQLRDWDILVFHLIVYTRGVKLIQ